MRCASRRSHPARTPAAALPKAMLPVRTNVKKAMPRARTHDGRAAWALTIVAVSILPVIHMVRYADVAPSPQAAARM